MKFVLLATLLLTQISFANTEESNSTASDVSEISSPPRVTLSAPGQSPILTDEVVVDLSTIQQRMPTQVIDSKSEPISEELLEAQVSHGFNQEDLDKQFSELEVN